MATPSKKKSNTSTSKGRYRNERSSPKKRSKILPETKESSGKRQIRFTELSGLKELEKEINQHSDKKITSQKITPYNFMVQWHLTDQCNLNCRYCHQNPVVPQMTFPEVRAAIDNVRDALQCWATEYNLKISPGIHFTGGEPLLRRDFFDILQYAREGGFSLSLTSNGTLITDELARRISESPVSEVQIGIEGPETIHDSIRGTGSFQRALRGIDYLVSRDVDTSINLMLTPINMGQIEELAKQAKTLGVRNIIFSRLSVCGRGEELAKGNLSSGELNELYTDLHKFKKGRITVTCRDPLFTIAETDDEVPQTDFPVGGCAAGVFSITITTDGSIMPCRRMNLIIGNIKCESFRQIWAESPVLWALRRRECYHDACQSCYYWTVCRGCRAAALAQARKNGKEDYLGPDPQCPYYRPRI